MTNIRYLKIDTCNKCEYTGHSANGLRKGFVFVCSNPIHKEVDGPLEKIGNEYYLITSYGMKFEDNIIPVWCKLPKEI